MPVFELKETPLLSLPGMRKLLCERHIAAAAATSSSLLHQQQSSSFDDLCLVGKDSNLIEESVPSPPAVTISTGNKLTPLSSIFFDAMLTKADSSVTVVLRNGAFHPIDDGRLCHEAISAVAWINQIPIMQCAIIPIIQKSGVLCTHSILGDVFTIRCCLVQPGTEVSVSDEEWRSKMEYLKFELETFVIGVPTSIVRMYPDFLELSFQPHKANNAYESLYHCNNGYF